MIIWNLFWNHISICTVSTQTYRCISNYSMYHHRHKSPCRSRCTSISIYVATHKHLLQHTRTVCISNHSMYDHLPKSLYTSDCTCMITYPSLVIGLIVHVSVSLHVWLYMYDHIPKSLYRSRCTFIKPAGQTEAGRRRPTTTHNTRVVPHGRCVRQIGIKLRCLRYR